MHNTIEACKEITLFKRHIIDSFISNFSLEERIFCCCNRHHVYIHVRLVEMEISLFYVCCDSKNSHLLVQAVCTARIIIL